jgi:hypothetical protein
MFVPAVHVARTAIALVTCQGPTNPATCVTARQDFLVCTAMCNTTHVLARPAKMVQPVHLIINRPMMGMSAAAILDSLGRIVVSTCAQASHAKTMVSVYPPQMPTHRIIACARLDSQAPFVRSAFAIRVPVNMVERAALWQSNMMDLQTIRTLTAVTARQVSLVLTAR